MWHAQRIQDAVAQSYHRQRVLVGRLVGVLFRA